MAKSTYNAEHTNRLAFSMGMSIQQVNSNLPLIQKACMTLNENFDGAAAVDSQETMDLIAKNMNAFVERYQKACTIASVLTEVTHKFNAPKSQFTTAKERAAASGKR